MKSPEVADVHGRTRLAIARRVAEAHRGLDDASLFSFVAGSTVAGLADERSDVDMTVAFEALPSEERLRDACRSAGGDWFYRDRQGEDELVVSFRADTIEVQIGYSTHAAFDASLDDLLVRHDPDTLNHKLAEGVMKGVALVDPARLDAYRRRLADYPPALGRAMVERGLRPPVSWRGVVLLLHRDAALWCRELQADACYRLLQVLAGLNRVYYTRFQVKRTRAVTEAFAIAPARLAERIDTIVHGSVRDGFDTLYALEGEVLDLVAVHAPEVDLAKPRGWREAWER